MTNPTTAILDIFKAFFALIILFILMIWMGYSIYKRYIEFETLFQEQTQLIETLNSKIDLLDQKLNTILPKSEVHSEIHLL